MLPIPNTLDKIQSCWQIPYIAHFCTLFNKYLDLPSFDTEDLEQALLGDTVKETLVPELITRLLRKCHETEQVKKRIGTNTFEPFLELFIQKNCEAEKLPNPYHVAAAALQRDTDTHGPLSFDELPVQHKAEIIQLLCETRFVAEDAQTLIEQANPDSLRVLPLGYDSAGAAYYYFFGTRLYRESNRFGTSTSDKSRKSDVHNSSAAALNKDDSVQLNGSLLNGSATVNGSVIHEDSVRYLATTTAEPETVRWELVCQTEQDWTDLTKRLAKSKKTKAECALVKILEQNFLPNISNLFRTKEKNERFNINKYVPVRSSTRVRVLAEVKQREEQESHSEKFVVAPLRQPFEKQFRWLNGGIQEIKRKSSPLDSNADTENKRSTRNKQSNESKEDLQIRARSERAQKRAGSNEPPAVTAKSKYVYSDSEEVY